MAEDKSIRIVVSKPVRRNKAFYEGELKKRQVNFEVAVKEILWKRWSLDLSASGQEIVVIFVYPEIFCRSSHKADNLWCI